MVPEDSAEKTLKSRPNATVSQAQGSACRYRFFEKASELAGVNLGKKFSAPQSLV